MRRTAQWRTQRLWRCVRARWQQAAGRWANGSLVEPAGAPWACNIPTGKPDGAAPPDIAVALHRRQALRAHREHTLLRALGQVAHLVDDRACDLADVDLAKRCTAIKSGFELAAIGP
jgi:hypothetical protein